MFPSQLCGCWYVNSRVVTDRVLCGPLLVCYLDGDANYVFWVCFFVVGGEWVVSVLKVFEVFKRAVLAV